jgi:large subunit ribosomal protein L10
MPTEKKIRMVSELEEKLSKCSIAIATDHSGLNVANITELRRHLRNNGVEYKVVKNTLAYIAAERINQPGLNEIIQGPTGLVLGFGDALEPPKLLVEYMRASRMTIPIRGAVMDGSVLTADQVNTIATLPSHEQLLAQLMGQMQAPISALLGVLQGTIRGFVTTLQRRSEQLQ